ncbi:MAG: T9SS type A sorting domain-containing protein, partial [Candidatus Eisenbacteria bacterium]|nr:T9SS type A sorting domain-containing protein [Candidatus Eisenbacteria bacterium]
PTVIRTVSWIESNYTGGSDTAERIRMFLQDAYATWGTTYVLLGGDTNYVPTRMAYTAYYGGWEVSTDLYFSDLDGNWNGDGDSRIGEGFAGVSAPGDSVDLYPDLFVGRAPAATQIEAETFVDKCLTYEKTPTPHFTDRILYLAEVLFPYDWEPGELISTDGAAQVVEPTLSFVPPSVNKVLLYQNHTEFPASEELNRQSAIDSINLGYNIVSHVGHGNKNILRVSKNNYITVQDADAFTNTYPKSGFAWLLDCTSAAIEYDAIAEHLMNNQGGGATSVFGPTRYCFPSTADEYYYNWFEDFYTQGVTKAGVVSASCKIPHIPDAQYDNTDRWTQMSYVFLGDPEHDLWTGRPADLTVSHPSDIPLSEYDLSVTVTDPSAVDSALVCVVKDAEVYATGYTDASGQVVLSFSPETTGTMTITVTAPDHLPYEDTINVTAVSGAHLTLRDTATDDDTTGSSDGNGNGLVEPGETIEISVTIGNGGQSAAGTLTATLHDGDPYVSLSDSTESLGTIPAGGVVEFSDAFVATIGNDAPNEYEAVFTLEVTDDARTTWTEEVRVKVLRPILVQYMNDVDDSSGDGDGIPESGETVTLSIDVLNEGNGLADVVSGVLSYPGAAVTITDSTDNWGDIAPAEIRTGLGGFVFTVSAPITDHFRLELTDAYGKSWTRYFDLEAPYQPTGLGGSVRGTTIDLTWDAVVVDDVWGYRVYRKDTFGGNFSLITDLHLEHMAYYSDTGLEEKQLYYYQVTAVDSSGNETLPSDVLEISTNPPLQNGWPLMGGETNYGTPVAADIDLDGDLEVLIGSKDVYCWHGDGIEYHDGDGDPRTHGIYATDPTGGFRSSLTVGELDGDEYPEIIGAAWGNVGTEADPVYEVWAWNGEDGTVLSGWPVTTTRFSWATPSLGDLDGDGLHDVALPCADGFMYAWSSDGTELIDGDGDPATTGIFASLDHQWCYGSAALVDIDGDGDLEIIAPSRSDSIYCWNPDGTDVPGWPVGVTANAQSSITVGDVDNDGDIEVIAGTNDDSVWLFEHDGSTATGWPKTHVLNSDFPPTASLADIDTDGDLEIIMPASDGSVMIWHHDGSGVTNWPVLLDSNSHSTVSVGDIDEDSDLEILVGCDSGKVYAFDADGSLLEGWPIQTGGEIYSCPTIDDVDNDGDTEVIVSSFDQNVYIWDTEGDYAGGDGVEWGTFLHDYMHTGHYGLELPVNVPGDFVEPPLLGLAQNVPNPFNPVTTIAFSVPSGGAELDLSVYTVDGRIVARLASGDFPAGDHQVTWDGRDGAGRSVSSGVYFVRLSGKGAQQVRKMTLLK